MPFKKKMDLNIGEIIKVLPIFTGEHKDLENFLNLLKLLYDQLKIADQPKLITLVLTVKISDNVRSKISVEETPDTFKKLKDLFNKIFCSKRSALEIQSELFKTKQTGKIDNYIIKIENLVSELNNIQKRNLVDADEKTIHKLSDQLALNAFKEGLLEELKPTVLASRPKSLAEAAQIASEAAQMIYNTTRNISQLKYNMQNNRNTYRGNNMPRYNNYRNFNGQNNSSNYNYNNNRFHNKNNSNFRGRFITRNNYRGRGNYNSNNRSNYSGYKNFNKNQNIHVLQHSGNEFVPPVTAQEDITQQMNGLQIH